MLKKTERYQFVQITKKDSIINHVKFGVQNKLRERYFLNRNAKR